MDPLHTQARQVADALGARAARRAGCLVLLIDCEEDRTLRAVLVGMLRETER